jgi:hypothetical protein
MGLRNPIVLSLTAATVVVGLVAPGPTVAASAPPRASIPDVTVLFPRALKLVRQRNRPTFSHAVMYEVDGLPRSGRATTSAQGIVRWQFVMRNSSPRFPSVTVSYGPPPRRFGPVIGHRSFVLEDVVIQHAPKMTLSRAVSLLRRAGHRRPFVAVTLRNPLGPKRGNPLYIFGYPGRHFIAVDTVTGKVRPIH